MGDTKKCAHPACKCMVKSGGPHGDYCSERCKTAGDTTELRCECHHPGCE